MTLGGRAAEEIVFGEITTGASNDLEKVTATAKQMVMRFGMSEKLGPRVFGHDHGQPFLGREFSSEPDYSDEIAREIDDEIRRIVEEAHQRARDILERAPRAPRRRPPRSCSSARRSRRTSSSRLLDGKTEEEVFGPDEPSTPPQPAAPTPGRARRPRGPAPAPAPRPRRRRRRDARPRVAGEARAGVAARLQMLCATGALMAPVVVRVTRATVADGSDPLAMRRRWYQSVSPERMVAVVRSSREMNRRRRLGRAAARHARELSDREAPRIGRRAGGIATQARGATPRRRVRLVTTGAAGPRDRLRAERRCLSETRPAVPARPACNGR